MKKNIFLLGIFLFLVFGCQQNEVLKTHGVAYLEKREKLIIVNKSNKNDTISILGQPSTKGMVDNNLWIYIERTLTRGKLLNLGQNVLLRNNVLVLRFDKYGILNEKKLYNKNEMKKLKFSSDTTEKLQKDKDFIYSFLSSVRQKMFANSNKKKN